MCRKKGNQLSVSKVKRVDRKASLMAYLKGHTESFVSCTNGEYDDEFASKNNIILLEIESLENTPYVDYQQVRSFISTIPFFKCKRNRVNNKG